MIEGMLLRYEEMDGLIIEKRSPSTVPQLCGWLITLHVAHSPIVAGVGPDPLWWYDCVNFFFFFPIVRQEGPTKWMDGPVIRHMSGINHIGYFQLAIGSMAIRLTKSFGMSILFILIWMVRNDSWGRNLISFLFIVGVFYWRGQWTQLAGSKFLWWYCRG